MVLSSELNLYLAYLKAKNYSPRTIEKRRLVIRSFIAKHHRLNLKTLHDYYLENKALRSIRSYMSDLKNFTIYLEDQGKIKGLSKRIDLPKQANYLPKIIYSKEELSRFLESLPERSLIQIKHKLLFLILYATGIRVSEARHLKLRDIDLKEGRLLIRSGKGRKDRYIPLNKRCTELIESYLFMKTDRSPYLFSDRGIMLYKDYISRTIRMYFPSGFTAHSFRHHLAIHLLQKGLDIRYIQDLLGHSDIKTTSIYTKVVPTDLMRKYREYHPLQSKEKK